uniref:Uncharacterized protein n=1 Tax=Globodera rostochiensis TaxID=31243 RepID=A0A914GW66_GLORO
MLWSRFSNGARPKEPRDENAPPPPSKRLSIRQTHKPGMVTGLFIIDERVRRRLQTIGYTTPIIVCAKYAVFVQK